MKKAITIFIIILLSILSDLSGFGQNVFLVLKKKTTGKEVLIKEGAWVKLKCKQDSFIKCKLKIINDSSIIAGSDSININDIEIFSKKSLFSKITGGALTGTGGILAIIGISIFTSISLDDNILNIFRIFIGFSVFTVGTIVGTTGILFLTVGKRYKKENWDIYIIVK